MKKNENKVELKIAEEKNNKKSNNKKKKETGVSFSLIEVIVIVIITAIVVSVSSGLLIFNNYEKIAKEVKEDEAHIQEITDTYNKILKDYVNKVNKSDLTNAAIEGMFNYLDDPYSSYLNKDETDELNEKLKGTYEGIGIEITNSNNKIIITRVFDKTSAKKEGLKKGDVVTKVDGIDLGGKNSNYLSNYIKYKAKTKIKLTIVRDEKDKEYTLKKTKIDYPVTYSEKYDDVGYIYLTAFSDSSSKQFKNTLKELEEDNIKSLIIDLRDNTGGYLNSAYEIAELFLPKGKVVYQLKDKKKTIKYKTVKDDKKEYKVAVLINGRSASASEVLALSLKEDYNAILIGEKSYGKGSVQQTNSLENGSMVKYTTAKWLSPNGESIEGKGIVPDINIIFKENSDTRKPDNQIQKAIDELKK